MIVARVVSDVNLPDYIKWVPSRRSCRANQVTSNSGTDGKLANLRQQHATVTMVSTSMS